LKEKFLKIIKRKGVVNSVLSAVVILVMTARFLRADYWSVFLCTLTLALFNIPVFVKKWFKVELSKTLEVVILLFIFSAEILGEIGSFYTHISWWDTMLHTTNGFLMGAIGFALIDILNKSPNFHISLSPVFVSVVALCISMTVGVVWEFFELGMDTFFYTDMQKDRFVTSISSVALNPEGINEPVFIDDISKTVVFDENGNAILTIENGYLDVGIIDTMKDLFVNFIGAIVFSVIGYFYLINRDEGSLARRFIPKMLS
jgi:hypothetical protein